MTLGLFLSNLMIQFLLQSYDVAAVAGLDGQIMVNAFYVQKVIFMAEQDAVKPWKSLTQLAGNILEIPISCWGLSSTNLDVLLYRKT